MRMLYTSALVSFSAFVLLASSALADCTSELAALKSEKTFQAAPDAGPQTADERIANICSNKKASKDYALIKACALSVGDIAGVNLSFVLESCALGNVRKDQKNYHACLQAYSEKYATNKRLEFYAPPCNSKEERSSVKATIECYDYYFANETETIKKIEINGIAKEFFNKCRKKTFRSQKQKIFSCLSSHNGDNEGDVLPEDIEGYYKACHIVSQLDQLYKKASSKRDAVAEDDIKTVTGERSGSKAKGAKAKESAFQ